MAPPLRILALRIAAVLLVQVGELTWADTTLTRAAIAARDLADAVSSFKDEHPGQELTGVGQLTDYLSPESMHSRHAWLPLAQGYVFLKKGDGQVPGEDGGGVVAIASLSLTPGELDTGDYSGADSGQEPGRFVIWQTSYGKVLFRWFPEAVVKKQVKEEVLNSITLQKPAVSPRQRKATETAGIEEDIRANADGRVGGKGGSATGRGRRDWGWVLCVIGAFLGVGAWWSIRHLRKTPGW